MEQTIEPVVWGQAEEPTKEDAIEIMDFTDSTGDVNVSDMAFTDAETGNFEE